MDTSLCREHLSKLLVEEVGALARLETLLSDEHAVLIENDVDQLERTSDARQACMGELLRIEDERRTLCRMMGMSADLIGMEKLLEWCDSARTLRPRWAECAERAKRCRELNDRNGALVTARLKRVEGLLKVVTGRNNAPATYGRQGAYATPTAGRVLSTEA